MTALQIWLDNHNRKLTQEAIDEALMEYIGGLELRIEELETKLALAVEALGKMTERNSSDSFTKIPSAYIAYGRAVLTKLKEKV